MCGLMPMATQVNVDFFGRDVSVGGPVTVWWVQLSTAIIFGLGFATLLTLVVTPVLLAAPEVIRENFRGGLSLRERAEKFRNRHRRPANPLVRPGE